MKDKITYNEAVKTIRDIDSYNNYLLGKPSAFGEHPIMVSTNVNDMPFFVRITLLPPFLKTKASNILYRRRKQYEITESIIDPPVVPIMSYRLKSYLPRISSDLKIKYPSHKNIIEDASRDIEKLLNTLSTGNINR